MTNVRFLKVHTIINAWLQTSFKIVTNVTKTLLYKSELQTESEIGI